MPGAHLRLTSHWQLPASIAELTAAMSDVARVCRWSPSTFRVTQAGAAGHAPVSIDVVARGFLPYRCRFRAELDRTADPPRLVALVTGDFEGHGICTATAGNGVTTIQVDWEVVPRRRLFQVLVALFRPLVIANHQRVLRVGMDCLAREVAWRRR